MGRKGEINEVVKAKNAVEAITLAWDPKDPRNLRTVHVEWMCPVESVKFDSPNEG